MTGPRGWRWQGWRRADTPRPDPDTGRAPLAPTPAADDPDALLREHDEFAADWPNRALRTRLVSDLAAALRRALADLADARRERDRLARRLRAVGAIAHGARFRLDPDADAGADDGAPCG